MVLLQLNAVFIFCILFELKQHDHSNIAPRRRRWAHVACKLVRLNVHTQRLSGFREWFTRAQQSHHRADICVQLSLGPGGTPLTFTGYLKVKCLSIFALQDPFEAPPVPTRLANSQGHLENLPKRSYPRPLTRGIAPQRQTTQCSSPEIYSKLGAALANMASCSGSRFELGTSCFEKYSTGIFSASPPRNQTCRGEICHAHPSGE